MTPGRLGIPRYSWQNWVLHRVCSHSCQEAAAPKKGAADVEISESRTMKNYSYPQIHPEIAKVNLDHI